MNLKTENCCKVPYKASLAGYEAHYDSEEGQLIAVSFLLCVQVRENNIALTVCFGNHHLNSVRIRGPGITSIL